MPGKGPDEQPTENELARLNVIMAPVAYGGAQAAGSFSGSGGHYHERSASLNVENVVMRRMLKDNSGQWRGAEESPVRQLLREAVRETGGSFKESDSRGPSNERRNREAARKGERGSLAVLH